MLGGAAATLLGGATPVGRLDVAISNLRSDKGEVRICVTSDPGHFPSCVGDALAVRRNVPATARRIGLEGLPTGTYAAAVIHDENGNRRLDTFAGIPREGFGFSRNPAIGFGPPRFSAAGFVVDGGADIQQIRMRYIL